MKVSQLVPDIKTVTYPSVELETNSSYTLGTFDSLIIDFANDFSKLILRNHQINRIPAYVALSYWLRKSNLNKIVSENQFYSESDGISLGPIGRVLHICPSNVDTMFLYSLFISLLTGNKNIVRISSRNFDDSLKTLFTLFNEIIAQSKYSVFKDYIQVISYERNQIINEYLSEVVDGRVIWGGDETIRVFKSITTNPRSRDIVFSDRISLSLIKVSEFLQLHNEEKVKIAKQFFNDAYTFDQKACSSPQMIICLGTNSETEVFLTEFYKILSELVANNYDYDSMSLASLKFNQLSIDAIENTISSYHGPNTNLIFAEMGSKEVSHSCGAGYFYTKRISTLNEIFDFVNSRYQTITYYGLNNDDKLEIIHLSKGRGVDRLVPIGTGLTFDYIWDGYNLIDELTTKKSII